jgi:hypothetical protein
MALSNRSAELKPQPATNFTKAGTRQKHLPLTSLTDITDVADVTNATNANPSLVADLTDIAVTDIAPAYVVVLVNNSYFNTCHAITYLILIFDAILSPTNLGGLGSCMIP